MQKSSTYNEPSVFGENNVQIIHSTGMSDYEENCFAFLFDIIKTDFNSAFIMQRNATCQLWFFKMLSLPKADEFCSFQFLDINETQ